MNPTPDATACPGLFCSGFEPEEPGSPWNISRDTGAVVEVVSLGDIAPHGGAHALHVILPSMPSDPTTAPSRAAVYHTFTGSPYTSGELYARAWFQVPASNIGIAKNHVDLFTLGNASHGGEEITLYLPGEQPDGHVDVWVDTTGSPDGVTVPPASPMVIPTGSWFCIALHVTIGSNGPLEFGLNQTQSGPQPTQTRLNDGFDLIGVGLEYLDQATSTATSELYVDDVAVSTSPLSCQ
jgi:hypothetical protein